MSIEAVTKARSLMLWEFPFWGIKGLELTLKPDDTCKTAWTDGTCLGFNPQYVANMPMPKLIGLTAHEIAHVVFFHPWLFLEAMQKYGISLDECQICGDLSVNMVVLEAGLELPDGALIDWQYKGMGFFQIIEARIAQRLAQQKPQNSPQEAGDTSQEGQEGKGASDDATEAPEGQGGESPEGKNQEGESQKGSPQDGEAQTEAPEGQAQADSQEGEAQNGEAGNSPQNAPDAQEGNGDTSQEGGSPQDATDNTTEAPEGQEGNGEAQNDNVGNCGECRIATDASGQPLDKQACEQAIAEQKISILQAAQQALTMGSAIGEGLELLVDAIKNPQIDWTVRLAEWMQQNAQTDYSFAKPNRQFLNEYSVIFPSLSSKGIRMAVIRDTSGSMVDKQALVCQEMYGIFEACQADVVLIDADDTIQAIREYTTLDMPFEAPPMGGYGTDFRPAFEWLGENAEQLDCVVYLTDLEGIFPEAPPHYPVLWVNLLNTGKIAPWGDTIQLSET